MFAFLNLKRRKLASLIKFNPIVSSLIDLQQKGKRLIYLKFKPAEIFRHAPEENLKNTFRKKITPIKKKKERAMIFDVLINQIFPIFEVIMLVQLPKLIDKWRKQEKKRR